MNLEVAKMADTDNWGEKLKERLNNYIDRLYAFLVTDDDCDYPYTGHVDPKKNMDIELHVSIKVRTR